MVCVYCSTTTQVTNSRYQRKSNNIWRRRKCVDCGGLFTTFEAIDYEKAIVVRKGSKHDLEPFSKDKLLISIYDSCRHRPAAAANAAALTQTVINKALPLAKTGILDHSTLIETVISILQNFDQAAATVYKSYHPYNTQSRNNTRT